MILDVRNLSNRTTAGPHKRTLEKMTNNDALPLKAVRRNAITTLKPYWSFESEPHRQTQCRFIYIRCGAPHSAYSMCDGLAMEQNTERW